jgi:hypothetical protein
MNAKEARRIIGGCGIEGWRWAIERPGEGVVAERPTDAEDDLWYVAARRAMDS